MYEDKFIAFVDILGFSALVELSEKGGDGAPTIDYILELLSQFGTSKEEDFATYGPTTCPCAPYGSRDLKFLVTQISDCAVISAEVSSAGLINLVHHCYKIAFRFLKAGHLCSGYVTCGKIYHSDSQFFGTGYQRAYEYERDRKVIAFQIDPTYTGTPFIEIDQAVCRYVAEQSDSCVKEVFEKLTESDGKNTAIWPFFAIETMLDIAIDQDLDAEVLKSRVQVVCDNILRLLSQLENSKATANANGRGKIEHIERKLREVLALKDKYLGDIDFLSQPFP